MKQIRKLFKWLSRKFHRVMALMRRKFWTDCPRCGKKFGGHEKHGKNVKIGKDHFRHVCGSCHKQAGFVDLDFLMPLVAAVTVIALSILRIL